MVKFQTKLVTNHFDGFMQERRNSISNALELRFCRKKPFDMIIACTYAPHMYIFNNNNHPPCYIEPNIWNTIHINTHQ